MAGSSLTSNIAAVINVAGHVDIATTLVADIVLRSRTVRGLARVAQDVR